MNTSKSGRPTIFDNALKVAVAREYLTSDLGSGALARKYNLPSADTVHWFVRWYKRKYPGSEDPALVNSKDSEGQSGSGGSHADPEIVSKLDQANLKIAGLEMLIEIAQKELGIDIVKKSGTKKSSK
jgi:transposase-like protein